MRVLLSLITALVLQTLVSCIPVSTKTNLEKAKEILDRNPLIDGHNDLAWMIRKNFRNNIEAFNLEDMTQSMLNVTNITHTDIKRINEGRLRGQFWAVYAPCDTIARDATRIHLEQIDVVKRLVEKYSDYFDFVTNSNELETAFKNKKFAALMGMESGHAIDSSMGLLRMFYELGIRYMTLTHNCDVPWATNNLVDNKPNPASFGGLNEFGKLVIQEMNRLGMIVDISHVSTKTMEDVLEVSKAPVMFSHSSVYQLCNHTRNVKDHVLDSLKENNGVIMINFYNGFVTCSDNATVIDVVEHIEYVRNHIGVDYIGIGADYDGVPLTPVDAENVSKYPNVFAELIQRGWTEEDLAKISGGNIIRVFKDVEKYAESVKDELPIEVEISPELLDKSDYNHLFAACRTY